MRIDFSKDFDARRWLPLFGLLIAMLLCLAVYWPGLNGPMLFDDFPQLGQFFHHANGQQPALSHVWLSNSGPLGRPISMLTFWLSSVLTPNDLAAWKFANLIIHMLCGLLAGLLAMELFTVSDRNHDIDPRYLGAFVGIIWLLHPLQVSTVLYTVQRMSQLAALFMFAGLYAYVLARRHQALATLKQTAIGLFALTVATALAALSKENGLLLPFLALAVELLVFQGRGAPAATKTLKYFFGTLCILSLVSGLLLFAMRPDFILTGYEFRGFTFWQRVLSEPRILFSYLYMLLAPLPDHMGFFHDDIVLSTGLLHPVTTLLSLVGLAGLIASVWLIRKRFPLASLGIAIFLIAHSMESSIIGLEPMFEHRNYFADFGVFLGLTDLAAGLLRGHSQKLYLAAGGLVVTSLTVLLGVRATHWSSTLNFYTASAKAHPKSESAIAGLAQTYLDMNKPELALKVLDTSGAFGAKLQNAYIKCRMTQHLSAQDLDSLTNQPMPHLDSYPVTGLTLLGALGIRGKCQFPDQNYSKLIDQAAGLETTRPGLRYMLYIYSGYYHQRQQQLKMAIAAMNAAHRMSPDTPVPLILSARWYLQAKEVSQASDALQSAAIIDRQHNAGFADDIAKLQVQIDTMRGNSGNGSPH